MVSISQQRAWHSNSTCGSDYWYEHVDASNQQLIESGRKSEDVNVERVCCCAEVCVFCSAADWDSSPVLRLNTALCVSEPRRRESASHRAVTTATQSRQVNEMKRVWSLWAAAPQWWISDISTYKGPQRCDFFFSSLVVGVGDSKQPEILIKWTYIILTFYFFWWGLINH